MNSETKTCQNCKQNFIIEPEDFIFYEKIKVPPPTWCPECRAQRRLAFRSGRRLYRRQATGAKKEILSSIPPEAPFNVYEEDYWWKDTWDPMDYGRDYDFSRPFFEQLKELYLQIPIPHRRVMNGINSDYCNNAIDIKDCYLTFNAGWTENCMYSETISTAKDCVDMLKVEKCESSYELFDSKECFKSFFSSECYSCSDVWFSRNLTGCQNCFGSTNLRNKNYHIFNKPYNREEYFKIISSYDLGSFRAVTELWKKAGAHHLEYPVRYSHGQHNVNVHGDYLDHCKDTKRSFYCRDLERCSYCQLILFLPSVDSYDMTVAGGELCYEIEEAGGYEVKFSYICAPKNLKEGMTALVSLDYTMFSFNASNLFGCIGVRNRQYCILNKQYEKEEYEKLRGEIIKHMGVMPYVDKRGRVYKYGEFFPLEFSPFPYNDTWAQEYFPLSKEEAVKKGFLWRELGKREYPVTISFTDLPDNIKDVSGSILKEVIECAHRGVCADNCIGAYKIIPAELEVYRKMHLPLPRLCPECRHYRRVELRNSMKLWHRQCTCDGEKSDNSVYMNQVTHLHGSNHCPNEFETSYAPESQEIVYCEACYQSEVQ